jgi:RNA polymerase II elongation factor ELL
MATALLPAWEAALIGAPDRDMALREAKSAPLQAMHVEMTQDIVEELLESARSGKAPQIVFGRTPVCVHASPKLVVHYCSSMLELGR